MATKQQTKEAKPAHVTEDGEVLDAVVRQTQTTLEEQFIEGAGKENIINAYKLASFTERQRLLRAATAEMTKLGWGGNISDHTRAAIARWGLENDVDPLRHLDVLGNRLYANATYYYDKVAALGILDHNEVVMMAPLIDLDFSALPVSEAGKKRLEAEAKEINAECLSLQMRYRVPQALNAEGDAAAAALVRLYWKDGTMTEGVNWAGTYKVKKNSRTGQPGKHEDPIGSENPTKTAVTRAFRKAAMQKVSVHKFAKSDEGTAMADVTASLESDRENRHREAARPKYKWANAPGGSEEDYAKPYGIGGSDEPSGQEGDQEAPVSLETGAEAADEEEEGFRQEEMRMTD